MQFLQCFDTVGWVTSRTSSMFYMRYFCFKTSWDGGWGIAQSTMRVTPVAYFKNKVFQPVL